MSKSSKTSSKKINIKDAYQALVDAGGRFQNEQQTYMTHVDRLVTDKKGGLGIIEGEVGLGKSLGYLLPICLFLAQNPKAKPVLISTHTRALQLQLLKKDLPLVKKALGKVGLEMPSYAFRMGRAAFFSPGRVLRLSYQAKKEEDVTQWMGFLQQVNDICINGSGLWQDYIEEYGDLPFDLKPDDVCLTDEGFVDNPAYHAHVTKAKKSRLIITNHASILSRHVFGDEYHMVVMDEAHEVSEVCSSMSNQRLHINKILRAVNSLDVSKQQKNKVGKMCGQLSEQLQQLQKQLPTGVSFVSDKVHGRAIADISDQAQELLKYTEKFYNNLNNRVPADEQSTTPDSLENLTALKEVNTALQAFCLKDRYCRRGVAFSKKQRIPSLSVYNPNAGFLFASRMRALTNRVLLTSGTLGELKTYDLSFRNIRHELGLADMEILVADRLSPASYGEMKFVKTDKSIPKPIDDYEEGEGGAVFNEAWLKHAIRMIKQASEKGVALVLVNSFHEAVCIKNKLKKQPGVMFHEPGLKASQVAEQFIQGVESGEYNVLVTPSMWHGVSFRANNGKQLLTELVITRLPFKPFAHDEFEMFKESMLDKGFSLPAIENIAMVQRMQKCAQKLRQGLGRGIRSPEDEVTVWFADPRFTFDATNKTGLFNAIPSRFTSNYHKGEIFGSERKTKKRVVL